MIMRKTKVQFDPNHRTDPIQQTDTLYTIENIGQKGTDLMLIGISSLAPHADSIV